MQNEKEITQEEVDMCEESPASKPQKEFVNGYEYIPRSCKHYPKTTKIYIFSCCNRPHPCYQCHDSKEDHKIIEGAHEGYCRICKEWFNTHENISGCKGCLDPNPSENVELAQMEMESLY